jgi:hypothetical protein
MNSTWIGKEEIPLTEHLLSPMIYVSASPKLIVGDYSVTTLSPLEVERSLGGLGNLP